VTILPLSDIYNKNGLSRPARTRDGLDVVIRVIVIGNEGHDHLNILRTIATGEKSLFSNNHALPMFAEFQFEDIIFGVFPKVGGQVKCAYGFWAKNSVGDIIEMLMQMLEVSFTFFTSCLSRSLIKGSCIYPRLEYCSSCEYFISRCFSQNSQNPLACDVSRMRSATILLSNGIRSRCAR
jgi:hypothetical protein